MRNLVMIEGVSEQMIKMAHFIDCNNIMAISPGMESDNYFLHLFGFSDEFTNIHFKDQNDMEMAKNKIIEGIRKSNNILSFNCLPS